MKTYSSLIIIMVSERKKIELAISTLQSTWRFCIVLLFQHQLLLLLLYYCCYHYVSRKCIYQKLCILRNNT